MLEPSLFLLLTTGFGLGLVHAFDADHVMALSTMANQSVDGRVKTLQAVRFCLRWALGHGGVLLVLGLLVFGFDVQLPAALSVWAERLVGLLLIALGGWLLMTLWRQKSPLPNLQHHGLQLHGLQLQKHQHGELSHTHLTRVEEEGGRHNPRHHDHRPVLVGITHGLAGSAPVLALIPAVSQGRVDLALVYILLFSFGVMFSMMVFGVSMGRVQHWLQTQSMRLFNRCRAALACLSMVLGSLWLLLSFSGMASS